MIEHLCDIKISKFKKQMWINCAEIEDVYYKLGKCAKRCDSIIKVDKMD